MPSVNKVLLMGHVGKDAEKKYLPSGMLTAKFSIATTENFQKNGQWEEKTDWHNIVIFGDKAEYASQVKKGELVFIDGKISTRSWIDQNTGEKKYATDIVANSVKRLTKNSEPEPESESSPEGEPDNHDAQKSELEELGL